MSDNEIADRIRTLIRETGTPLTQIAENSGVSRHILWNFVSGRTSDLSASDADKVMRHLTGKGIEL
jgi:hypothetical protein